MKGGKSSSASIRIMKFKVAAAVFNTHADSLANVKLKHVA
jgi:hypothetical protein